MEVVDVQSEQLKIVQDVIESTSAPKENKMQKHSGERHRPLRLPLARVKNIMKLDPECHIISQDAVFLTTKATELFIEFISRETIDFTNQTKRKTVLIRDLEKTISSSSNLCFLDGMLATT